MASRPHTWFFETSARPARAALPGARSGVSLLFNSYYNAVGDKHPRGGMLSRPGWPSARLSQHVDDAMVALLGATGARPTAPR